LAIVLVKAAAGQGLDRVEPAEKKRPAQGLKKKRAERLRKKNLSGQGVMKVGRISHIRRCGGDGAAMAAAFSTKVAPAAVSSDGFSRDSVYRPFHQAGQIRDNTQMQPQEGQKVCGQPLPFDL
jgi:hypothetical protein